MKKVLKFLWKTLKHILLLPLYCSIPDKYSGITYQEWLTKEEKDTDKE